MICLDLANIFDHLARRVRSAIEVMILYALPQVKRKLKELKLQIERDRRHAEREKKDRERIIRKAEKLAEKAARSK